MRVVLSGYFGFGNAGDEALLSGVLAALRASGLGVEPVVLSAHPRFTAHLHRVRATARDPVSAWRALRGAVALVSGGGSLFQDVTSRRSPLYYLAILEAARLAGAAAIWFAQGMGPLRTPLVRRLVARAARSAALIVVRDARSREELASMGVSPARIHVAADAVWLLEPPAVRVPAFRADGARREGPARIGVCWRRWPGGSLSDEAAGRALGRALAAMANAGSGQAAPGSSPPAPLEVRVLALHPAADLGPARCFARAAAEQAGSAARLEVAEVSPDPQRFLAQLAELDAVISARLHGLIGAALAGVPPAGLASDPKVAAFMEELGWPLAPIERQDAANPAAWRTTLERLLDRRAVGPGGELRARLEAGRQEMAGRAREGARLLAQALEAAAAARAPRRPALATAGPRPSSAELLPAPDAVPVLGVRVHRIGLDGAFRTATRWLAGTGPMRLVVTLNPEMVMHARAQPAFASQLGLADLVVADGVGILLAARLTGSRLPGRVPGIELAERLLAFCAARKMAVFLVGGRPGVAERAAERLRSRLEGLVVAGTHHGYFAVGSQEEEDLLSAIERSRPSLLLAGMGSPRQERWLFERRRRLAGAVRLAMGVGGSLDVWAGEVRRAPALFRRTGTEWLFRLVTQPWRARRMLALPRFAALAVAEGVRGRLVDANQEKSL